MAKKTEDLTVELFAVGKWNGMPFDQTDLKSIAAAFHILGDNLRVPLKMGHNDDQPFTDGQPALGWVTDLWEEGSKLFGKFSDVPGIVQKAFEKKLYRNVSIELEFGVEYKQQFFPYVLSGVALLGADIPAVNTLADLMAYMSKPTGGELKFSKKLTFTAITNQPVEDDIMPEKTEAQKLAEEQAKFTREKAEHDAAVAKFEAEKKQRAEEEARAKFNKARTDFTTKLDDLVKDEVITPAQRDKFLGDFREDDGVISSLNYTVDSLREVFTKGEEQKKSGDTKKGEHTQSKTGDDKEDKGEEGMTPDRIVLKRVNKLRAGNSSLDFSAAKRMVLEDDTELARQYVDFNEKEDS